MTIAQSRRIGPAAIFLGALLWSTGGFFIKTVSLDAWGVSFWRSLFAAVTLALVYALFNSRIGGSERQTWLQPVTLFCAALYAALLLLFVIATKLTTSANAIFLQYTAPIYVLFVEPLISGSRIRRSDILSVLLSTVAMLLFFVGKAEVSSAQLWGNIAALVSGVAFAGYAVMMKHERVTERTRWHCVIIGHSFICAITFVLWLTGQTSLTLVGDDLARLAYLGVIQIGIAYAFFTYGLKHVRAIDATLISMIEPILNPVWVFIGIGERPSNYAILGGLIILAVSVVRTVRGTSSIPSLEQMRSGE
jgi:drug/metabolite transporter (DMT)-like permease